MKTCTKCNLSKPEAEFVKNRPICKDCRNAYMRDYYSQPDAKAKQIARVQANPRRREHQRLAKVRAYGFESLEAEQAFKALQPEVCPICENAPATHLDHDHATVTPRGLLCANCNTLLGMAGDDVATLQRAILYLQRGSRVPPS